jgi:Rhs element Vgr protein
MPSSPLKVDASIVSYTILSAGSEIPATYEILDLRIDQHINKIAEAEITVRDGNTATQTFEVTDSNTFKPGSEIEIKLGYQGQEDSVFKGVVTKQIVKVNNETGSQLIVVCKDKALASVINRKNAIFTDMKDSAVIEQLAGNYGLQTDITATSVQHKEIVQYYSTDWDFIINRSEINGLIVVTDSGKLTVAKPAVSDSPALQIQFGYDVIEFDGELDATTQYTGVDSNAWDMSSQSIINASASEPSVNEQGDITGSTLANVLSAGNNTLNASVPITQDDIQNWANAALLKSRLSRFKGSITFQGSSKAKVNSTIKIMGMSNRFNGNAYISGVTHILDNGQWHTETKIGLSSEWFVEKHPVSTPIASGLLPGVKGLQTGIVKKIYDDPDNEFRVQVEVPILGADGDSIWARLGTFYSGNGFGAFFMPEVNDEVILGFMNDDPRFPIILGSVYSSSIPAPETPDEKNTIKTILTQSKLQLKFDEENKVITLLTPGGNTIVISDEDKGITLTDQNNNKIQMNDSGIVVDSASDLTLKAAQSVTIQGASVSVKADESLSCTGGTVSISGNQSTSITGSAECTISSDGQMSVKGTMVGIN